MATKNTNDGTGAEPGADVTAVATDATAPAPTAAPAASQPEGPTPENTPKPGGGSWHWDDSAPGWVENTYA